MNANRIVLLVIAILCVSIFMVLMARAQQQPLAEKWGLDKGPSPLERLQQDRDRFSDWVDQQQELEYQRRSGGDFLQEGQ
jgi:hypothetical protein